MGLQSLLTGWFGQKSGWQTLRFDQVGLFFWVNWERLKTSCCCWDSPERLISEKSMPPSSEFSLSVVEGLAVVFADMGWELLPVVLAD